MFADPMRNSSGRAAREVGVNGEETRAASGVRKFRSQDVDAIMAIVADSPQAAEWSRESYLKFAEEEGSLGLVIQTNDDISGFLMGRRVADEAEVLNLAVATNHRRKGEATALLRAALGEFRLRAVKSVYLEVRESNTGAIAFYERHGFAKMGRREDYYRSPDEAAITMEKKLTG